MAQNTLEHINEEIREKVVVLHELSAEARKEKSDLHSNTSVHLIKWESAVCMDIIRKLDLLPQTSTNQNARDAFENRYDYMEVVLHQIGNCRSNTCPQNMISALNLVVSEIASEEHQQELDQLLK